MNLYNEYKKLVKEKEYGKLKRAWFTTFTISPDFIERYILPPLLNLDNEVPKTLSQFETINVALDNSEIDICFFYDAKMPLEGFKRTTVKLQGIYNNNGLFHPKVTLIEFEKKTFLMVGSANLTLSGWGRNREAVTIKEIGEKQADQVIKFFESFNIKTKVPKAINTNMKWDLIYKDLSKVLKNENNSLYVWSPYFSSELESTYKRFFPNYNIKIIPDKIDGKIRLSKLPNIDKIEFFDDSFSRKDFMTHAKIWLTQNKICIGSHNFTSAALGNDNIEASIIDEVDSSTIKNLTRNLNALETPILMTEEELKENDLSDNNYFDLTVHLEADWKNRTIRFYFLENEEKRLNDFLPFTLYLPGGIKKKQIDRIHGNCKEYFLILDKSGTEKIDKFFNALLSDRVFHIEAEVNNENKIITSVYIEEVGANINYRNPHKYTNLQDFFIDSITDTIPENSNRTKLTHEEDSELNIEEYNSELRVFSYFEIFQIFMKLKERISEITYDSIEFIHTVCYAPNSLKVLKSLLEDEMKSSSSIYSWFIINEFNSLLKNLKIKRAMISPIKQIKLNEKNERFIELASKIKGYK